MLRGWYLILFYGERRDACLQRQAVAHERCFEESFHPLGLADECLNFRQFLFRERLPTRPRGRFRAEAMQERGDFRDGEAHPLRHADDRQALQNVLVVATATIDARWYREQADAFVVADGGGANAHAPCNIRDGEVG